jgi:hypothetical protein
MFFTRQLLQQATGDDVARVKAKRFTNCQPLADLCCGIGGDLFALAPLSATMGVDRNPVAIMLAAANCRALGLGDVQLVTAEVQGLSLSDRGAWHIDPDRRITGRRTAQPAFSDPPLEDLQRMVAAAEAVAIKLAPAAQVPDPWQERGEREWIGSGRQCRQQVIWLGSLARQAGCCSATVVADREPASFVGQPGVNVAAAGQVGRYVVEPHAAVLAAGLEGEIAERHELAPVLPGCAYLTGDRLQQSPLWSVFEVVELSSLDRRKLKQMLRARGIGRLEVKVRGMRLDPRALQRQLRVPGEKAATLLVAAAGGRTLAILARRVAQIA